MFVVIERENDISEKIREEVLEFLLTVILIEKDRECMSKNLHKFYA